MVKTALQQYDLKSFFFQTLFSSLGILEVEELSENRQFRLVFLSPGDKGPERVIGVVHCLVVELLTPGFHLTASIFVYLYMQ